MRYTPIDKELFRLNRANLKKLLPPQSLAVVNANDILPSNGDAVLPLQQNSDFFYLTGIEQEESLLLLYPDAHEAKHREILFLRQPNPLLETWEGHKLTKEEAKGISGAEEVQWLADFPALFHRLMCECSQVYLNSNEHKRARVVVESRDARFIRETRERYPLHDYRRLAPVMHRLRAVKSEVEIALLRKACAHDGGGVPAGLPLCQTGCQRNGGGGGVCARVSAAGRAVRLQSDHRLGTQRLRAALFAERPGLAGRGSCCCWTWRRATRITTRT